MMCGDLKDYFFLMDPSWFSYDEEKDMYILHAGVPEKAQKSYQEYLEDMEEMESENGEEIEP